MTQQTLMSAYLSMMLRDLKNDKQYICQALDELAYPSDGSAHINAINLRWHRASIGHEFDALIKRLSEIEELTTTHAA